MTKITLNDQEKDALIKLLQYNLSELSSEIADTDKMDFRESLKEKRELLSKILERLEKSQHHK